MAMEKKRYSKRIPFLFLYPNFFKLLRVNDSMKKLHFIFLLMISTHSISQKIDNMASFRDVKSDNYFRFHYDNDYFTAFDQYYTQGYNFEFVSRRLQQNPANYIFVKPKRSEFKYGIAVEHIGFTPTSIKSDFIRYGDRPFAAAIMLKSFSIATDTIRKSRFISSLHIGLIGPGAFGMEMQKGIHEWVGDDIPLGWQYQIKNDIVLNYEINYEKQLVRWGNFFALQSNAAVRIGTLFTNMSVGFNATLGLINAPFSSLKQKNNFQLYIYSQPIVNFIGYDATLQGGIFNNRSPYTSPNSDVERITAQDNFGIVMQYRSLYLEYTRTLITREFATGSSHKWGGIRIGFKL